MELTVINHCQNSLSTNTTLSSRLLCNNVITKIYDMQKIYAMC